MGNSIANEKGVALACLAAIVSGISVFANSFGVLTIDATAYTFLKNILVAAILSSILLVRGNWRELFSLDKRQALMLAFIGVVGGGVAFALFFSGLAATTGAAGSFVYRLLFVFAAIIGVVWLKESFSWKKALGAFAMLGGNFLLLGNAAPLISAGALLVLGATVLWACEYAVSKKALEGLSATTVAAARMGIGAIVLLAILAAQGHIGAMASITPNSIFWIAVATGFLTLFTTLWYSALKQTSLIGATAAFTLGGIVSALLSFAFAGHALTALQAGGFLLLASGAIFIIDFGEMAKAALWARQKAFAALKF